MGSPTAHRVADGAARLPSEPSVTAVDVAASALARLTPRRHRARLEQLRHDLNAVLGGFVGRRPLPFSDRARPPTRPRPLGDIDPVEHLLPGHALRRRWVTLRTDVKWIAGDLRGEGRPATVPRGPSRYRRADPLAPRPLRVREVTRETADAVTIALEEPSGEPLRFEAGQFLTFHLTIGGRAVRRAYSLSSSPLDGPGARVTVKRLPGGLASGWMHQVRPGDVLMARGPAGRFTARDTGDAELTLIAGGSGITPIASIAETALRSSDARVRLLYGNRRLEDVIFADRLDALARRYPDRFTLARSLDEPPAGWGEGRGPLDEARVGAWLDALDDAPRRYFLCGPSGMLAAARAALAARGVPASHVLEERFGSPETAPSAALPDATVTAHLRVAGRDFVARVAPGSTLLEAGLAAGAPMPFSCAMGGCGACRGKLRAGQVQMDEPSCLTARERAEGFVLPCCSRPLGDVQLEVD